MLILNTINSDKEINFREFEAIELDLDKDIDKQISLVDKDE